VKYIYKPSKAQYNEKCSSSIKKHSLPTEWTKVHMRDLSHARYFQRELTHANYKPSVLLYNNKVRNITIHFQNTTKYDFAPNFCNFHQTLPIVAYPIALLLLFLLKFVIFLEKFSIFRFLEIWFAH